jgi:hypothetical protein
MNERLRVAVAAAEQSIYHDPDHPSSVVLAIFP